MDKLVKINYNKTRKIGEFFMKSIIKYLMIFIVVSLMLIKTLNIKINSIQSITYNESNEQISYSLVSSALSDFYNNLNTPATNVLSTTKFLCTGTNITCAASSFTNIGLLNIDEFNKLGTTSYLVSTNSYWTMTTSGSNVYKITSSGIQLDASTNTSGVRPTIYLKNSTVVSGSGYYYDPYVLE